LRRSSGWSWEYRSRLAEATPLATLTVFALVNLALLRIRFRRVVSDALHVTLPIWIPALGPATCIAMIASAVSG
jgi:APA family basic amino acid/polyamine antiporter